MAFKLITCLLGMFVILSTAFTVPYTHTVHERRNTDGDSIWIKRFVTELDYEVPVRIGLSQKNLDSADDLLMDVSDPNSKNYGKHWTSEQIVDLFAPTAEAIDQTRAWLEVSGISSSRISLSTNKIWLQFDAKITELENLLYTKFFEFEHPVTGAVTLGCDHYHIPTNISHHVDLIKPGVNIPIPEPMQPKQGYRSRIRKRSRNQVKKIRNSDKRNAEQANSQVSAATGAGRSCAGSVSPDCYFQMYNIPNKILTKQPNNSVSVYEMDGELFSQQALNLFFKSFTQIPVGTSPEIKLIDGARSPATFPRNKLSGEATLDLQTLYPLAYPDTVEVFQVNTYRYNKYKGLFNIFLDALDGSYCNYTAYGITGDTTGVDQSFPEPKKGGYKGQLQCGVYKPTKVISISYGYAERTYSTAYQRRQCNEFLKLGLQGTTIVVSSGDYGVNSAGSHCGGANRTVFNPGNPVGCPYILSVGATRLPPGAKPVPNQEKAVNQFGSGGGFSNIYPRPKYQTDAVKHYLQKYVTDYPYYETKYNSRPARNETHGVYNRAGRGYPDVSAVGQDVAGWLDGRDYGRGEGSAILWAGTSVSAPVFAGVLTRINNYRLAAGKSSIGFVNPTLYTYPEMLNDVTEGENNPPGTRQGANGCGTSGFHCAPGWDPVTGLGTPNFPKMLEVFMKLP